MILPDDIDSFDVGITEGISPMKGLGDFGEQKKKRPHPQNPAVVKESKDYAKTIIAAVEASNQKLISLHLPFRFYAYTRDAEVFIDVLVLDFDGNIISEKKRNISHQDFERLIEDVSQIEGLFLDKTA